MIVVIPSNRSINLRSLAPLIEYGARFIVVDDSEGSISINHPLFSVYNWKDRKRILGKYDDLFPRRNGVCRDFGFYLAWRESEDDEIIVALDDDCEIHNSNFSDHVEAALSASCRPFLGCTGLHLNILDAYSNIEPGLFPRGFPYQARQGYQKIGLVSNQSVSVPIFNLGLWTDAFDVNAIDKIQGPTWRYPDAQLAAESFLIPKGVLISVCSMNMQFRRKLIPATFQLPMNIKIFDNWVVDRYGDIWGGFILKLLVDRCGDCLSIGAPMINHRRGDDFQRNIWQEHIAHFVNSEIIDLFFQAVECVDPSDYLSMMQAFGEEIWRKSGSCSTMLKPYIEILAASIENWCLALNEGSV